MSCEYKLYDYKELYLSTEKVHNFKKFTNFENHVRPMFMNHL